MRSIATVLLAAWIAPSQPTAADVRIQLNAYLSDYEPKLSALIADERMTQRNEPKRGGGDGVRERRSLASEVAFIALPGSAGWLGFRRVEHVNDKPVENTSTTLSAVLGAGAQDDYARAREMLADSARFNLGTPRTINLPNLPLELLHWRHEHRFSIRLAGTESIRGHKTTKLVLVENAAPTIIRATDNGDIRSIVSAFVEEGTGRLWRADVVSRDPRDSRVVFDHVVSVEFREDRAVGMLVPARMHEDFFAGSNRKAWSDAEYRNYRRFQTSARIVPQP